MLPAATGSFSVAAPVAEPAAATAVVVVIVLAPTARA